MKSPLQSPGARSAYPKGPRSYYNLVVFVCYLVALTYLLINLQRAQSNLRSEREFLLRLRAETVVKGQAQQDFFSLHGSHTADSESVAVPPIA